jgi:hypothetical protein
MDSSSSNTSNKITSSDKLQQYVDFIISAIKNGTYDNNFDNMVYQIIKLMNDNITELLILITKRKNYNTTEFQELFKKMKIIQKMHIINYNLVEIYHNYNKIDISNNFEFQKFQTLINNIKSFIDYNITDIKSHIDYITTDGGGNKKQKKVKVQYKGNIYERVVKKDKNGKNCIIIDNQLHLLSKLKIV